MPSGAKKRKAAKKKKEKAANTKPCSVSHSNGHDKLKKHYEDCDIGKFASPSSQNHHDQEHRFIRGEGQKMEKGQDISSVEMSNGEKPQEEIVVSGQGRQEVLIEEGAVAEVNTEPKHHGSSSRSSSDDECLAVAKNGAVVETAHVVESVKHDGKTTLAVDLDKTSILTEVIDVDGSASAKNNLLTSCVVELGLKQNGKTELLVFEESTGFPCVMDVSRIKEDEANYAASSDSNYYREQANKDKQIMFPNSLIADAKNRIEHPKDSEVPEYSDGQPLIASAPRVVQRTSWKSCCGLFEVFTGSNA